MMTQPYKPFEERRNYPRVSITRPVSIDYQDKSIEGVIHDISADGLQVRCTRKSFQTIHPTGRFIRKENAPVIDLMFHLKVNGHSKQINVRGLVYYFVVLPEEKELDIAFGLRFISLDDDTISNVTTFIETAMIPDEELHLSVMKEPNTVSDIKDTQMMNSYDMQTALLNLLKKHQVSVPPNEENDRYQCLTTCIETLFDKISEIDNRIYQLEDKNRHQEH